MPALNRIAHFQNRRDEVPNQELARDLAAQQDRSGIQEIAQNLWNKDRNVQNDCLKVLYEIGYLEPALIADYSGDFLELLNSKNNRMVWGSLIALSTLAAMKADEIYPHAAKIQQLMETVTVITRDNGIKILSALAAAKTIYNDALFPFLVKQLENCRSQDMARYAEEIATTVNEHNRDSFVQVINKRLINLDGAQIVRLRKVLRTLSK